MTQIYNDPNGSPSSVGTQFETFFYQKKALMEAAKEMYFGQLADTTSMPKHFGKTIKKYHYLPLLHDGNINDQGIDAAGTSTAMKFTITIVKPGGDDTVPANPGAYLPVYIVGEGANAGAAQTDAETKALAYLLLEGFAGADYAAIKTAAETADWLVDDTASAVPGTGNLYGSSKDVGTITGKLPALSETGGRVNRVGFKRIELEGSIEKFGFFEEYTQESLDFDTDSELEMHINREMIMGANEITEDALQIDLLNGAGVVKFGGDATTTSEVGGDTGSEDVLTYEMLMKLSIELDNNRCPKSTKMITGSRMIDTKVINGARVLYIGSELIPSVRRMTDLHGDKAFIEVQHYAAAGNVLRGEIGSVDQFRIVVVPEMMHWEGAGGTVGTNGGYRETGGNYDVFPALVVGDKSFTTIGFQTDGKTVKFKVKHSKPGSSESYGAHDPYGELGFMSIKWYYGSMILRPERIALCKVVAEQ